MLRLSASLAIVISAPFWSRPSSLDLAVLFIQIPRAYGSATSGSHVELKRLGFAIADSVVLVRKQIFETLTWGRFTCASRTRKATAHPLSAQFEASETIIAASTD
jgi:hypothetical protein